MNISIKYMILITFIFLTPINVRLEQLSGYRRNSLQRDYIKIVDKMDENIILEPVTKPINLGEGPFWDSEKKVLYFVDIYASKIHCYDPKSGTNTYATLGPKPVTFIIPIADTADEFLISHGGELEIVTWDRKSTTVSNRKSYIPVEQDSSVRLNDAKCSPSGKLFLGSMGEKLEDGKTVPAGMGNFFVLDHIDEKPSIKKLLGEIGISNGLSWNSDENILYWCDTLDRKIFQFDYNKKTLEISNQIILLDYEKAQLPGKPDGMVIDTDGYLWVASVEGGHQVIKINPDNGEVVQTIDFGDISDVTSLAWGGEDFTDLYVTTIFKETEKNSGCVFKVTNTASKGCASVPVQLKVY